MNTDRGKSREADVSFTSRLIFIQWVKVDGKHVYQAKPKSSEQTDDWPPDTPALKTYPDSTPTMW
ncbi:DUF3577 domain-containing protein [Klebsiella aerogenes]|uniref:DUF3577 domain-containing protein n=1 Tax=Klebsiella aerogenes TaxID=548 RepID=UPI001159F1F9|nr:DUF3577 domain-containing protein [Klebsiella aerogenes]